MRRLADQLMLILMLVQNKDEKRHVTKRKLADFGVAKMLTREAQEAYYGADVPGVPTYMGPEVLRDFETYSAASDVWSLGCVIAFCMRDGQHVFNCNDDVLYYEPGMASDMIFTDECYDKYSSDLIRLVYSMIQATLFAYQVEIYLSIHGPRLQIQSRKRPTAQHVLNMCTSERQAEPQRY